MRLPTAISSHVLRNILTSLSCLALLVVVAQAQTFTVLHNFSSGSNGSNPFAGLTINGIGNLLYGTTGAGGTGTCSYSGLTGCGTIFKLNLRNGSWTFDPLYSFQGGTTDGEF